MKPRIDLSVITVTFNNFNGLRRTYFSLSSQSWRSFEWIVIDGDSSDETKTFLMGQNLSKTWLSEPDRGIYDAMNKGVRLAKGQYFLFLNAGDELYGPNALSFFESFIDANDDILLFGFALGNRLRFSRPPIWCYWKMPTSHQAMLFHSRIFADRTYLEGFRTAGDFDFFLWAFRANKRIERVNRILVVNEPYGSDTFMNQWEYFSASSRHIGFILATSISALRLMYFCIQCLLKRRVQF